MASIDGDINGSHESVIEDVARQMRINRLKPKQMEAI